MISAEKRELAADIELLKRCRLHDPRRVLGAHAYGSGRTKVRVWLPDATAVQLCGVNANMRRIDDGLFEWSGVETRLPSPYRVSWRTASGDTIEQYDPYAFGPQLDEEQLRQFSAGEHHRAYRLLGAHEHAINGVGGVLFAVWAPNAERVSVVGDFNRWDGRYHPMSVRGNSGVWELFLPELGAGQLYKYEIRNRDSGMLHTKTDPYGTAFEYRPATASRVQAASEFKWHDDDWLARRGAKQWLHEPISVYELHLGSWRRNAHGEFLSYAEIARELGPYIKDLGFTHVEFLPITEHPLDDSWGYQCTGYFAPTRRHGEPDELRAFIDELHKLDIGVILDWVPGHFPRDDHALARFDGTALYEYADPLKGEHPDWGTLVFDYTRKEVSSFLLSSALYWLDEYHFDGLRVDAVASMLYLDYSRSSSQWRANAHGGNSNLEAIEFLKRLNEITHGQCPGTITLAEESTAWPQVSRPTYAGGLGFSFKWNMGWMHDTLAYMREDPVHRKYHHQLLSFGPLYVFTENFVSPLSHDEVVHGKKSLWAKMPGDDWQKFANLRLLYTYQWTYPGKKLLFMGSEFAQPTEWDHHRSLPWYLAGEPARAGIGALLRDLNGLYRNKAALHAADHDGAGFAWLAWDDAHNSVLSFVRRSGEEHVVVVLNFTPVPRHDYRVGVPQGGKYREAFNSDSSFYGGSNLGNGDLATEALAYMGHANSIALTLPPLAALILEPL
jgi:1,4-alpha-glucan branching enzyme